MTTWTDVAALADGAVSAPVLDETGAVVEPIVLVDLDGCHDAPVVAAAARAAASCDRILLGVCTGVPDPALTALTSALDLTVAAGGGAGASRHVVGVVDVEREVTALTAAVAATPQAASVLTMLVRWSGALPVPAALDAESHAYSMLLGGPEFRAWLTTGGPRRPPPVGAPDPVLVERTGDTLWITLNRPARRNAYGRELRDALVSALQIAVHDGTVGRVVLSGAGPAFSSGGDLAEFGTAPDPVTAHLVRTLAGAARPLHRIADRTEVRLHGMCVGAGIELPAFARRVVATPDTAFRLPEVGMGLIPGAGGTVSIPRRIGRWRFLHLALTGRSLDAATADEWGLADEVVAAAS